tara:strand:- start:290 stop:529 length:240 start_codon:yes stop_codon:yes gene_type:complete
MPETITAEEVARHYTNAGDSVTLINRLVALSERTDEEVDSIRRNVGHLKNIVARTYWTTEDLAPFNAAITAGTAVLPTE